MRNAGWIVLFCVCNSQYRSERENRSKNVEKQEEKDEEEDEKAATIVGTTEDAVGRAGKRPGLFQMR